MWNNKHFEFRSEILVSVKKGAVCKYPKTEAAPQQETLNITLISTRHECTTILPQCKHNITIYNYRKIHQYHRLIFSISSEKKNPLNKPSDIHSKLNISKVTKLCPKIIHVA